VVHYGVLKTICGHYYIRTGPHAELGRIAIAFDKCTAGASAISAVALGSTACDAAKCGGACCTVDTAGETFKQGRFVGSFPASVRKTSTTISFLSSSNVWKTHKMIDNISFLLAYLGCLVSSPAWILRRGPSHNMKF
jgi:hypothetical protein